ncbi:MAG: Dph6-related ATP pyrophosphatase [Acidimicrobiales bacterium]
MPRSIGPVQAWMSWSSGKDSALALDVARRDIGIDVVGLLCTVNAEADRVAMHAVRRTLLEAQADRLALPLRVVDIPSPCPNDVYEARMDAAVAAAVAEGVEQIVFGDLFLEDIRAYREQMLAGTGLSPVFPLWAVPTDELARTMLSSGIRAVVTCVDPCQVPGELAGRAYDETFLADLPEHADPCGERGEFHTFVWDGPGFSSPIDVDVGEVVERDGFVFCDVLPA